MKRGLNDLIFCLIRRKLLSNVSLIVMHYHVIIENQNEGDKISTVKPKVENLIFYGNSTISRTILYNLVKDYNETVIIGRQKLEFSAKGCKFIKVNDLKNLSEIKKISVKLSNANFFENPVHVILGAYENPKSGNILETEYKEFSKQIISNLKILHNLIFLFVKKLKPYSTIILFSGGGIGGDAKLKDADSYLIMKVISNEIVELCSTNSYFIEKNIRIFSVSPGPLESPLSKSFVNNKLSFSKQEIRNNLSKLVNLIKFLLGKKSTLLSGSILSSRHDSLDYLNKLITKIENDQKLKNQISLFSRRRKIKF